MVKQAGFLAENLVGIAVGLGIFVILVSLWVADASRRTQEIEGMIERADLDAATFYLPMVVVPAQRIEVVSKATLVQAIHESQVHPISSQALKLMHPFSTTYLYLGLSKTQNKSALWVHQERFGNTSNQALLDATGDLTLEMTNDTFCLGLSDPRWVYCHHQLMSSRAGPALIAVLIVMAVLGFLWVGDWVLRLTDEMTRDRVIQMEQKHRSASQAEWDALDRLIQEADPLEGWQPIEYVIPDGVSERVVSLKLANVNGQWMVKDRQVVWRAKVVSH